MILLLQKHTCKSLLNKVRWTYTEKGMGLHITITQYVPHETSQRLFETSQY